MFCANGAGGDHLQPLKPGQTTITVADPRATTPAEAAILGAQLLAEAERQNIRRLLRADQQHDRIVAWSLVRLGLSQAFQVSPSEWVFSRREDQRPFVLAPRGLPPFQFSLAHTRGLIALLVTSAALGGVDIEHMERTDDLALVAPKICAASELAALDRLSGGAWKERFFELWTLKEAYAKARGAETVPRWSEVAFEINAHQAATVQLAPGVADTSVGWQFWRQRITAEHMLAAAVRGGAASETCALQRVRIGLREQMAWLETLGESTLF